MEDLPENGNKTGLVREGSTTDLAPSHNSGKLTSANGGGRAPSYLSPGRIYRDMGLRYKMIVLILGVVSVSVIPLSLIVLYRNQAVVLDKTYEVCLSVTNHISGLATEELLVNETYDATQTAFARLRQSKVTGLEDAYIINIDGEYVAEYNNAGRIHQKARQETVQLMRSLASPKTETTTINGKPTILFSFPILIRSKSQTLRVGAAFFEFNRDEVYAPVNQIRNTILVVAGILFVFGIAIAYYVAYFFSRPIQKLSEGARLIGEGDLNHRIRLYGKDELGRLATTFNQMTQKIQDFTHNLEAMVDQRTRELNETLAQVQALKIQQDGDYFLTAILVEPLQPNNNKCDNVRTEFRIEQKKKFHFRKWNSMIGGDVCITDTITLMDREYAVFINGDAMGKSLQGAGGVLVLGAVFNSSLVRTHLQKNLKIYPEGWLRERFMELQAVFTSFNGSMYISVCMGLVDNLTGMLYYINAEHPFTVLYRKGKATFLEQELELRKLGMPEQEEQFRVRTMQLLAEDVLIAGSDGRDDIVIRNPQTGEEKVNDDEFLFLKHVEQADGLLDGIIDRLKASGTVLDDISLLRLSYRENNPAPIAHIPVEIRETIADAQRLVEAGRHEEVLARLEDLFAANRSLPELLKTLGAIYFHKQEYARAAECFESYLEEVPSDNEYIYALSNVYRLGGQLNRSADLGERLFLRDRKHLLNLLNLSAVYFEMGVMARALFMVTRALEVDADNSQAMALEARIREAQSADPTLSGEGETSARMAEAEELYAQKKYKQAIDLFLDVARMDARQNRALFRAANCYVFLNRLESAAHYYRKSLAVHAEDVHVLNNLGSVYFRLKKYDEARESWNEAVRLQPGFQPARVNLERLDRFTSQMETPV